MVGSVADAVDRLRVDVPDVILSDIAMPEIDGFGLVERVRAAGDPRVRALPIIGLSAHASAQDEARALAVGFDAYLAKPFEVARLARAISELIRLRLTKG